MESAVNSMEERKAKVLNVARSLFNQSPDWMTYFNQTLGGEGIAHKLFPSQEEYALFERSEEYDQIDDWVAALRKRAATPESAVNEPTKVITVRVPLSLHELLNNEAEKLNTSVNKLCITKLIQFIRDDRVPKQKAKKKPRGKSQPKEAQRPG